MDCGEEYKEFDITYNNKYDNKFITYGTCFLANVDDSELTHLKKTSFNCIYKVYKHDAENTNFIKIQMTNTADSLQDEANILSVINDNDTHHDICAVLKSKFIVILENHSSKHTHISPHISPHIIIRKQVKDCLFQPCIVTSAFTRFGDFKSIFDNICKYLTAENPISIIKAFFKTVFELFCSMIELSQKTKFVHNDLHMQNIIYNRLTNKMALLDFGRSYIDNAALVPINRYRYIPSPEHTIPVMTDIMGLSKTILDQIYDIFLHNPHNKTVYNILYHIAPIFCIECKHNELSVRFANINNELFKNYVSSVVTKIDIPVARELLPGIIYLVIYLNTCTEYIEKNNVNVNSELYYRLPYNQLLNRTHKDKDAGEPFWLRNKLTAGIYDTNFTSANINKYNFNIVDYMSNLKQQYDKEAIPDPSRETRPKTAGAGPAVDLGEGNGNMEDAFNKHLANRDEPDLILNGANYTGDINISEYVPALLGGCRRKLKLNNTR